MTRILFFLALFWLVQAGAHLLFKLSSLHEHRFLLYFMLGHLIGVPSLWLVTELYKDMNENLAFGLAMGGAFLSAQFALFIVFRPQTSTAQWLGVLAICAGMILLAAGGKRGQANNAQPTSAEAIDPETLTSTAN